jgi:uncharacterized protein (TIGR02271 family)
MALAPLSRLDDWELENDDQDLRGNYLKDYNGNRIGQIDEMIVDTDQERVVAVRLEDGAEYPVSSLELRDGDAYLLREGYAAGSAGSAGTATTRAATDRDIVGRDRMQDRADIEERAIPLVEERLRVQKRSGKIGEVEVHTHPVEEQRTIQVPVAREEVFVERRDVAERPADAPVAAEGETIRVPVMAEEADVHKEAVVTGEVVVGKRQTVENREVSDTVRRTEVEVDREGDAPVETNADRVVPLDRDDTNRR